MRACQTHSDLHFPESLSTEVVVCCGKNDRVPHAHLYIHVFEFDYNSIKA